MNGNKSNNNPFVDVDIIYGVDFTSLQVLAQVGVLTEFIAIFHLSNY